MRSLPSLGAASFVFAFSFAASAQEASDADAGASAPPSTTSTAPTANADEPSASTPSAIAPPPPAGAEATSPELVRVPRERKNAIQADLGLAVVGLAYERMLLSRLAVQLEAQVFGTWFGPMFDLPNMSGFGGQVRPTWFVTNDGPRGVYVAPFFRVDRVRAEKDHAEGKSVGFSTGIFGGYSFVFGEAFNLRIGAGAQYMSYVVVVPAGLDGRDTRLAFKQFFPALDLVLGYAF
jgi:hypothetical protein